MKNVEERRIPTAFTLIEMLVVIAVISILATLLLPALNNAKEKGRHAACVSNLRQVALSARLYMDDHEGPYGNQGWIRYDRHQGAANYVYTDGHVEKLRWRKARTDHFPDHRVRNPLAGPPN
ncbi:MAG TPA: prepilin-type N-terminal cleavage/methylation domain-containing protein [Verrucomicrobiae bacterium]|nr:prepilin-type N-terminal cleavage/methylation domain-containing protein [Verrucomicrobiae bacterium]